MPHNPKTQIPKIVSGAQTGADRAALDWAIKNNVPHGGWCPKGRRAEDGTIPECYNVKELTRTSYLHRTERNVVDSDGTVIFSIKSSLSGGSKRTAEFAQKHGKPMLHVHPGIEEPGSVFSEFVAENQIEVLNVAGPRASTEPTIGEFVMRVLDETFFRQHATGPGSRNHVERTA